MKRRRLLVALAIVMGTGGVVTAGYLVAASGTGPAPSGIDAPTIRQLKYATVGQGDLVRVRTFDAVAGYGEAAPVVIGSEGTLTWLPEVGSVVKPGDAIVGVDGRLVFVAAGSVPMWRDLAGGVTDGIDVEQVERMLEALGYGADVDLTVDQKWTSATTRAVRAYQKDRGMKETGTIARGDLVFLPEPVRVSSVGGSLGQSVGDAAIAVTGTELAVTAKVKATDRQRFVVGEAIVVKVPDGSTVDGIVRDIGSTSTDSEGKSTAPVTVGIDPAALVDVAPGAAVSVELATVAASDSLLVPVEALVALAEGGYAVEVRSSTGTRLVGVEPGAFADGKVAITPTRGELAAGDEVVIP